MAELKWFQEETRRNGIVWRLYIPHRNGHSTDVWQIFGGNGKWVASCLSEAANNSFPDAESAMRAAEVELIRRCSADLLALEDLHGEYILTDLGREVLKGMEKR